MHFVCSAAGSAAGPPAARRRFSATTSPPGRQRSSRRGRRLHELAEDWRQVQPGECGNDGRQSSDGGGQRSPLAMNVDAEAPGTVVDLGCSGQRQRKIDGAVFHDPLADARSHECTEDPGDLIPGERCSVATHKASTNAEDGLHAGDDEQIARPSTCRVNEQCLQRIAARHLRRRPGRLVCAHRSLAFVELVFIELANEPVELGIR